MLLRLCLLCLSGPLLAQALGAQVVYPRDKPGFLAAAGGVVGQDFDSLPAGSDITGMVLGGITFDGPGSALVVVRAADTFSTGTGGPTHVLIATTGDNVLSPGGIELAFTGPLQEDDLTLTFAPPVTAFGLDLLWQSADGQPFTTITVRDTLGTILFTGAPEMTNLGGGGAPAGTDFWGIISAGTPIATVEIDEMDTGFAFPDSNIGFDSLLLSSVAAVPVLPEFGLVFLGSGLVIFGCLMLGMRGM